MTSLYIGHFGLAEAPFSITPNPHFFYAGSGRGSLLEALRYALQSEEGIVTVIGEVGSGKTMLCRMLLDSLPDGIDAIYLANPSFSSNEILDAIAHDLGVSAEAANAPTRLDALNRELIDRYGAGRRVVLLIDEAHAMPRESLEEIRLLSNLETSRHKLLNIVLFGQPELGQLLLKPDLRQLRERVVQRFTLGPLPSGEVRDYLEFRLRAAGHRGSFPFTPAAVALIGRASHGLSRRINILADKGLLAAFARNATQVEVDDIRRAVRDVSFEDDPSTGPRRWWRPTALAAGIGVAFAIGLLVGRGDAPSPVAAPAIDVQAAPVATPEQPAIAAMQAVSMTAASDRTAAVVSGVQTTSTPSAASAQVAATGSASAPLRSDDSAAEDSPVDGSPIDDSPGDDPLAGAERDFRAWVGTDDAGGYTLQIASVATGDRRRAAREFDRIATALPSQPLRVQQLGAGERPVRVFYAGEFADARTASAAIAQLPADLRNNQPIVRSLAAIRSGLANR